MDLSPLQYIILVLTVSAVVFVVQKFLQKRQMQKYMQEVMNSPEDQKRIADSQHALKIAMEIKENIIKSGAKIEDLSVASSVNSAALSGRAKTQDDKELAGKIASEHPEIKSVSNGILLT